MAAANAIGALLLPPGDGDRGWQEWLGMQELHGRLPHALGAESFAATGAPWVPHEWLFSALLAAANAHALGWAFALAVGMCATVALACVALRCARAGASPPAIAFVMIFTHVAMSQSFGVRVQVVGWAMLAALLLVLELPPRARPLAILVTVAWANVHASAALAPVVCAAAAGGSLVAGDVRGAVRDGLIALGAALAVCATPLGTALPVYAVELAHSPIRHWIREWHPVTLRDAAMTFGALPIVLLAACAVRRAPRRTLALAAPFVYLLCLAVRNVPLAAIACAPLAALGFDALVPSLARFRAIRSRAAGALAGVLVFGLGAGASAVAAHAVVDPRPLAALAAAERAPHAHRLFCEDFGWCGDATGKIAVFLDGRADPFPPAVWTAYDTILHVRPAWRGTLRRYGVDAMLVNRGSALDRAARGAGWRIARDGRVRLLLPAAR
ncbi:MAG TPA: hypothetical protein VHT53_10980 [Candidatus Elarobacter sp.]|nr:hypothetical protein [Candidatus Elarobacter sp.]